MKPPFPFYCFSSGCVKLYWIDLQGYVTGGKDRAGVRHRKNYLPLFKSFQKIKRVNVQYSIGSFRESFNLFCFFLTLTWPVLLLRIYSLDYNNL